MVRIFAVSGDWSYINPSHHHIMGRHHSDHIKIFVSLNDQFRANTPTNHNSDNSSGTPLLNQGYWGTEIDGSVNR